MGTRGQGGEGGKKTGNPHFSYPILIVSPSPCLPVSVAFLRTFHVERKMLITYLRLDPGINKLSIFRPSLRIARAFSSRPFAPKIKICEAFAPNLRISGIIFSIFSIARTVRQDSSETSLIASNLD